MVVVAGGGALVSVVETVCCRAHVTGLGLWLPTAGASLRGWHGQRVRCAATLMAMRPAATTPCFAEHCLTMCCDWWCLSLLPACPVCKTRALMAEGSIARCKGWFSGATR